MPQRLARPPAAALNVRLGSRRGHRLQLRQSNHGRYFNRQPPATTSTRWTVPLVVPSAGTHQLHRLSPRHRCHFYANPPLTSRQCGASASRPHSRYVRYPHGNYHRRPCQFAYATAPFRDYPPHGFHYGAHSRSWLHVGIALFPRS